MLYSKELGFIPQTNEQKLAMLFSYAQSQGFTGDFTEFKGSNIHRFFSSSLLPALSDVENQIIDSLNHLFSFFDHQYQAIANGSSGASYSGWQVAFQNLATGLHIVDGSMDTHLKEQGGGVSLYFDNLLLDENEQVIEAFQKCVYPGMVTPFGTHDITVPFTLSSSKSYKFFNLLPEEYTPLYLRIFVRYKQGSIVYEPTIIERSVRSQFELTNRIGRGFYVDSYFDHNALPNIASMRIMHSVDNIEFLQTDKTVEFGSKLIIAKVEVLNE